MKHVMCDLETLATNNRAVIISVGLVAFDMEKSLLGEELYLELDVGALKEQIEVGRTMSLDTLAWWMQQSDSARSVWKNRGSQKVQNNCILCLRIIDFFNEVSPPLVSDDWKEKREPVALWGNGATFDNVLLRSYFDDFNMRVPWHYANDYCYRTMKAMFANRSKVIRLGTHHNALDDAKTQATHLIDMMKRLK